MRQINNHTNTPRQSRTTIDLLESCIEWSMPVIFFFIKQCNFWPQKSIFEFLTKKGACGNRPAGGKWFLTKNKVSFSGAIFPPKVFTENYRNKEAAVAAKRPWPRNGLFPKETLLLASRRNKNRQKNMKKCFFQFSSRTWGIILAIIACLFELVDGL